MRPPPFRLLLFHVALVVSSPHGHHQFTCSPGYFQVLSISSGTHTPWPFPEWFIQQLTTTLQCQYGCRSEPDRCRRQDSIVCLLFVGAWGDSSCEGQKTGFGFIPQVFKLQLCHLQALWAWVSKALGLSFTIRFQTKRDVLRWGYLEGCCQSWT